MTLPQFTKKLSLFLALAIILCSCTGEKPSEELSPITLAISKFSNDRDKVGSISLGRLLPVDSEAVKEVLKFNEAAIPYLLTSLHSGNSMIVGQSACCLFLLKCKEGREEANSALVRLRRVQSDRLPLETSYAIESLERYINFIDQTGTNNSLRLEY